MKTLQYFANCTTVETLTKERNRLALIHHPDRGGDLAVMQEINAQFEAVKKRLEAPPSSRVYTCPRSDWDELYEKLQRSQWAERMRKQSEELERREREKETARKKAQEEVNRQRNQWASEIEWAVEQLYKLSSQGLMRGCYIEKGTRVGVPYLEITGNTYPYKEHFKRIGFRWEPERKVWYFYKKNASYQEKSEEQTDDDDYFNDELEDIPF